MGEVGLTGKQMCEFIAACYERQTGRQVDPKRIWSIDPRGELWPVYDLHEIAEAGGDLSILSRLERG